MFPQFLGLLLEKPIAYRGAELRAFVRSTCRLIPSLMLDIKIPMMVCDPLADLPEPSDEEMRLSDANFSESSSLDKSLN